MQASSCLPFIMHHAYVYYLLKRKKEREEETEKDVSRCAALTISRDKTLCLRPLISIIFVLRMYSRLRRIIASAIQSPRNYRAITRIILWANITCRSQTDPRIIHVIEDSSNFRSSFSAFASDVFTI